MVSVAITKSIKTSYHYTPPPHKLPLDRKNLTQRIREYPAVYRSLPPFERLRTSSLPAAQPTF